MTSIIEFTKMHGLGNDYIYVDTDRFPISHPEECARRWSQPHTAIGSDGLILISRSQVADFRMRIFNADGTEAMMCGNGSRCVGKYVYDKGLTRATNITLETLSGIKRISLEVTSGEVSAATVAMGKPVFANTRQVATPEGHLEHLQLEACGTTWQCHYVGMGNPHCVIFTDNIGAIDITSVGRAIEFHPLFPERTNVEFVERLADGTLRMRVWERGSGITQACGTGACATAVAACRAGIVSRFSVDGHPLPIAVKMDGGSLSIRWDADDEVLMTGPAETAFEGTIKL